VEELSEVEANHRYELRLGKAYVNLVKRAHYLTTNECPFSDRIRFKDRMRRGLTLQSSI
jgi:hypothetical protein